MLKVIERDSTVSQFANIGPATQDLKDFNTDELKIMLIETDSVS